MIKKLNKDLRTDAPNLSDKISQSVDWDVIKQKNVKKPQAGLPRRPLWGALAACAALIAIIVPLCITLIKKPETPVVNAAYDVMIDVNPNIVLTVGEDDAVTGQKGLNEDGIVFLHNKNFIGQNVQAATQSIFAELKRLGLITQGSIVRISAYEHDTRKIKDNVQAELERKIESLLGADVTTLFLSDDELDKIEEYYENNTINADEEKLVEEFKQKVLRVAGEKLAETQNLLAIIQKYKTAKTVLLTAEEAEKLSAYVQKHNVELDFDPCDSIDGEEFEEFIEELEELIEDLSEDIRDIEKNTDDYSDLMEDLIDLIKECLWD